MTDKERKEAVKRLRAENREMKDELSEFKAALRWMRYFDYQEVFHWSMQKEDFETLQRLVGGSVKYRDSVLDSLNDKQ